MFALTSLDPSLHHLGTSGITQCPVIEPQLHPLPSSYVSSCTLVSIPSLVLVPSIVYKEVGLYLLNLYLLSWNNRYLLQKLFFPSYSGWPFLEQCLTFFSFFNSMLFTLYWCSLKECNACLNIGVSFQVYVVKIRQTDNNEVIQGGPSTKKPFTCVGPDKFPRNSVTCRTLISAKGHKAVSKHQE